MKPAKRKALEAAGWKVGDAADFLEMNPDERQLLDQRDLHADDEYAGDQKREPDGGGCQCGGPDGHRGGAIHQKGQVAASVH